MVTASSSVRVSNEDECFIYDIEQLKDNVVVSYSTGSWSCFDKGTLLEIFKVPKAHTNITGIISCDQLNGVITCGSEGEIHLWDIRSQAKSAVRSWTQQSTPFTCIALNKKNQFATGSELTRSLASVQLWDVRSEQKLIRQWNDAHNDDITHLQFHPKDNELLLTGSVDGLVSLLDTTKEEDSTDPEEDPLLHVINHGASIHLAKFVSKKRVMVLSHMESYAMYKLKRDKDEKTWSSNELFSIDDLRAELSCSYVINEVSTSDKQFCALAFGDFSNHETKFVLVDTSTGELKKEPTKLERASEEICRAISFDVKNDVYYSGGEDGLLQAFRV
ncbi:WD repeat protein, human WDR89 family [Schizosaccharomyces pombe]|uniref:Uncharacterized WD repeat-containing protein C63.06 n=1 Tax=Schizosaccharomyces pombe (strain 972 / ATCC 24843) TaxID=284812 RepID=YCJ6_SCHPO|nr:WD repeat-containing protein [Schizosaccharomyces pombe]Q9Y7T2.1 RecName: Full=Uncharacterized WD repeat-containing protein C63.06 [Schizosaccharomyces pombe 972h-]CAB40010.1 human WDR89 family WD repeat protein [Schizosaccharomyces pombe]|eukprot:NP_587980.1 WD repeat-containing protein [Schizosaccharomyces pombe]